MMVSLAHRLEVAKAAGNTNLLKLLEQEQQQLQANLLQPERMRSLRSWMHQLKQGIGNLLPRKHHIQIREFLNGYDHWWYACDFQTGRCFYADSKAELEVWLKEHPSMGDNRN